RHSHHRQNAASINCSSLDAPKGHGPPNGPRCPHSSRSVASKAPDSSALFALEKSLSPAIETCWSPATRPPSSKVSPTNSADCSLLLHVRQSSGNHAQEGAGGNREACKGAPAGNTSAQEAQ